MMRMNIDILGVVALGLALSACHGEQATPPAALPSSASSPSAVSASGPSPTVSARADDDDDDHPAAKPGGMATSSAAPGPAAAPKGAPQVWSFETDKAGGAPAGFSFGRTGSGASGRWIVQADPGAPSGANVLAQLSADGTDSRFPVAVADTPVLRDARVSVRCKPISGVVDQACGLVFRYRDENNYYITRANALEDNVRLYTVKNGHRSQFDGWTGPVTGKAWHELRVDARGDHIEVFWDGKKIIDGRDSTFPEAGKVGVWTKADSVTYFDDLSATPL
jgi:hypothetical protein